MEFDFGAAVRGMPGNVTRAGVRRADVVGWTANRRKLSEIPAMRPLATAAIVLVLAASPRAEAARGPRGPRAAKEPAGPVLH